MSAFAMLRRSGGVALLLHVWRVGLATASVWPLSAELDAELSRHVYAAQLGPGDAALLLQVGMRHAASLPYWVGGCALLHLLLTPLFALLWLHAMQGPRALSQLLRLALGNYLPALALGAGMLLALAPALAPAWLALRFGPARFPESEAAQASIRLAAIGASFAAWLTAAAFHDRARAALVRGARPLRPALRHALRELRPPDLAYRALLTLACALLLATAELMSRSASGMLAPSVLGVLQQLLLLPATALTGLWLARTLGDGAPARPTSTP